MEGVFRFDSKLFRAVEKVVNLIKLNILWILCSIPIVTGPAALSALHTTAVRILENEEGYIFRDFWTVFKSKWKQSLKIGIPLLFVGAGLLFDHLFWKGIDNRFADAMKGFVWVLMGIWLLVVIYIFPLAARMETTARMAYRNAALLIFKYLPQSLYLLFITGIFILAGLLWTPALYVEILAGGSLLAVVHGKMLVWIFKKENMILSEEGSPLS